MRRHARAEVLNLAVGAGIFRTLRLSEGAATDWRLCLNDKRGFARDQGAALGCIRNGALKHSNLHSRRGLANGGPSSVTLRGTEQARNPHPLSRAIPQNAPVSIVMALGRGRVSWGPHHDARNAPHARGFHSPDSQRLSFDNPHRGASPVRRVRSSRRKEATQVLALCGSPTVWTGKAACTWSLCCLAG